MAGVGCCMSQTQKATGLSCLCVRNWYVPLRAMTGLNLNKPEEAVRQQTALMVQQTPGSKTWEVWRQEFQKRMDPRG